MTGDASYGGNYPQGGYPQGSGYPQGGGYQQGGYPAGGYPSARPKHGSGMAITALVLGILALVFCWTVFGGIVFGIVALILGLIASSRSRRGEATGGGMAIAGVITGVIGAIISILLIIIGVSIFNSSGVKDLRTCLNNAGRDQAKVQSCEDRYANQVH